MSMSDPQQILGEWLMRRGDRNPLLSVILEDDAGVPLNLTGCKVWLILLAEDGDPIFEPYVAGDLNWWEAEAYIYNAPAGLVVYDWPDVQTASLAPGVNQIMFRVDRPDGSTITVPSEREARLIVRPAVLAPSFAPAPPPP